MGVQVVAKGVDAEQYAVEYAPPVRRGLEGIFFTNTSLEKAARNYAAGKSAGSIVGAPVVNDAYITCKGMTNFIQTNILETESLTMLVIAKSSALGGSPDEIPLVCGSYGSGALSGACMYMPVPDRLSGTGGFGNDDASNANVTASISPTPTSKWGLYSVQVSPAGVTTKGHTSGLTNTFTQTVPRRLAGRTMRIGSGYSNSQKGTVDIAMFQHYSVLLTADELAKTVADIRAYAARRGILV
ncbi:hypothetical protein [Pseudomonas sp.]|uniref:hypothetical protein n=1 Tax=Pseudomonas sp. TaxID=306 RepID=UPI0031D2DFB4